jgi:hypothetical protein
MRNGKGKAPPLERGKERWLKEALWGKETLTDSIQF